MKKNKLNYFWVLTTLFSITSCTTFTYYHPVNHIAPVFEQKGEFQIFGGLGTSDYFQHGNLQFTYSLDSVRFISGNALLNINKPTTATDNNNQPIGRHFKKSYYYDFGYGKKVWQSYDMCFFLQGTAGYGNTYNETVHNGTPGYRDLSYLKLNIIPTIIFNNKYVELGGNLKVGGVYFSRINDMAKGASFGTEYYGDFDYLKANRLVFDFQPSAFLALGYKKYKIFAQGTAVFLSNNIRHDELYLNVGARYIITNSK